MYLQICSALFDRESKASSENSSALSFDMMFKSTKDQYGFGLQQPEQSDYELYKRWVDLETISVKLAKLIYCTMKLI